MSEIFRPNVWKVCFAMFIQSSIYPPPPALTQPTNNAHDLYHFTKLCVLCWFEVEQSGMVLCKANVICWSGVAVVVWSDGLILVGRSGQTMVWCGSWCIVWSVVTSETTPIVWCGGLIWEGSCGLVVIWEGLIANGWLVFVKVIKPNSYQRQWKLSDLCENLSLLYHFIWQFKSHNCF